MSELAFEVFKGGESRQVWEIIPTITYNGEPFPRDFRFTTTKHSDSIMFEQDYAEGNILLDAIIPAGLRPSEIWHLEPAAFPGKRVPDFRIVINGAPIFVECTRAGDQSVIRFEDKFPQIDARLNEWVCANEKAAKALAGRYIAFLPQQMPRAKDEEAFVNEMRRFILNEDLTAYTELHKAPEKYAVLRDCEMKVVSKESKTPHRITLKTPAMSTGGPFEAVDLVIQALEAKRKQSYDDFRPVWLAIGISNLQWPARDVFARLQQAVHEIGPFERLFVCNSNEVMQIAARNSAE